MVKRRFSRKRKFSRKRRKSRSRKSRKVAIPRQLIPTRQSRIMRYSTTFEMDPITGVFPSYHIFRMNSILDPDYTTGAAHNCMGYELFMGNGTLYSAQYDHFAVVGAKIKVRFTSTDSAIKAGQAICGVTPRDGITLPTTLSTEQLREMARTKHTVITSANGSKGTSVITSAINPNKFLSVNNVIGNSLIRGNYSLQPSEQGYWYIWAGQLGVDAQVDTSPIICNVELEYATVFTEPIWRGQN